MKWDRFNQCLCRENNRGGPISCMVQRYFYNMDNPHRTNLLLIYRVYIFPDISYASQFWASNISNIQYSQWRIRYFFFIGNGRGGRKVYNTWYKSIHCRWYVLIWTYCYLAIRLISYLQTTVNRHLTIIECWQIKIVFYDDLK